MAVENADSNWRADGKFFRAGGERVRMRAVTYGPFPGGWPADFGPDFRRISAAGFNAVRLFEMPGRGLLDAAADAGLAVFGGLSWGQNEDFLRQPGFLSGALVALAGALDEAAGHRALAGVYVANEIPSDLVRWMGPVRVREAVEELIAVGHEHSPGLLFAYANYPSTEYLEPENADFTAFNVYLEDEVAFRSYVRRLHHIAGDRPLVISEFGLDSLRNGEARQAEVLGWARRVADEEEAAGFTVYAWSDRWWNNGGEVLDWSFGLVDREGRAKPALEVAGRGRARVETACGVGFSVIVCTRNGRERIGDCLRAVLALEGADFEVIVVDDGSVDGTGDFVAAEFPEVSLLRLKHGGLSVARNAGAAVAEREVLAFTDDDCEPDAEWLLRLGRVFAEGRFAAAGGPNLPPPAAAWREAVVAAAPGAPSHVMLDDREAEHLPGCNLAVRKAAFDAVGGFDPRFHTAGDDVDFCWRLRDAGFALGFAPGAFVWHRRRPSLRGFLRQQLGYGKAERMLMEKFPQRFSPRGGAKWEGCVYSGGPVRVADGVVIYHGLMGRAGYQSVACGMQPLRGLETGRDGWRERVALWLLKAVVPRLRAWERCGRLGLEKPVAVEAPGCGEADAELVVAAVDRSGVLDWLLENGWRAGGETDGWDVEKGGARLLLATGYGDNGAAYLMVRVWGDAELAEVALRGYESGHGAAH